MEHWKNKSFNTQRKHAINIVKFLNYLFENKKQLRIKSLNVLTILHGTEYLNKLVLNGVSKNTIKDYESTLTKFYYWLSSKNICLQFNKDVFRKTNTQFGEYIESPFNPLYPKQSIIYIEHTLPLSYIPLLIEVAILVAKPIVLGLYFQIFGGLRISEVINLSRTDVARKLKKGNFLFILKNQNYRTDLKEYPSVKRPRHQEVFEIHEWGQSLFRDHINLYKPKENNTNALFINRDGKAMSVRSYRQYFQKIKDTFISLLESKGDYEQQLLAKNLKYMKWSTHIGRGTFTNMIAEEAKNPYEIAHLRGDLNINSALTYMSSTDRIHEKIEEKFSTMHTKYIPSLINIDNRDEW
ncbi:hypothetical protein [Lysinibacillus halotolerans]|uniref:hypothetical protein n=1 Tax=Lysinibacillus halotolerans TaxID=1368476 RepID=UPI001F4DF981|nr:hypothetical protein [Lysinibacillus halotolerans]